MIPAIRVKTTLRNATANVSWLKEEFPQLRWRVDVSSEVATAPDDGYRFCGLAMHNGQRNELAGRISNKMKIRGKHQEEAGSYVAIFPQKTLPWREWEDLIME